MVGFIQEREASTESDKDKRSHSYEINTRERVEWFNRVTVTWME